MSVTRRVVVTGSRRFHDAQIVRDALDHHEPELVIQGGAYGADLFARDWCKHNVVPCLTMEAHWSRHGKAAGPMRNGWMLTLLDGDDDCVLAFPIEDSKGTRDCIRQAELAGIPVHAYGEHG